MKILVISQYYYPEQFKINDICESLVEKGHSVTVITGLPNYPSGVIFDDYMSGKNKSEIINGVKVERCFLIGRGKGAVKLGLNYLSFMISSSIKAIQLKDEFEMVFVYQLSPVFMAMAGITYKKKHNVPLYLYCLDLWPESLKVNIKNKKNIIFKSVKSFSKYIYNKCDLIGVTSKPFIQYLNQEHKIDLSKLRYLPQHGYDAFSNLNENSNTHSGINVSYFGNIGKVQDFDIIITNMDRVNPNVTFHIIGDGSELESLKQKLSTNPLNQRIILHGYKQKEELIDLYKMTDICLLTLKSDSSIGDTLPSKMIEYLSVNKPILAIARGSVQELIDEVKCGYCVNFGDDQDFIDKINTLATDTKLRLKFGENGRKHFDESFTKDLFILKLENQLNELNGGTKNV